MSLLYRCATAFLVNNVWGCDCGGFQAVVVAGSDLIWKRAFIHVKRQERAFFPFFWCPFVSTEK